MLVARVQTLVALLRVKLNLRVSVGSTHEDIDLLILEIVDQIVFFLAAVEHKFYGTLVLGG